MAAAVRVTMAMVREAVADIRSAGIVVTYHRGRVMGLRAIRQRTGGCAARVRSMAVMILAEEGLPVGSAELRAARATLLTEARAGRAAQRGGMTERRTIELLADLLAGTLGTGGLLPASPAPLPEAPARLDLGPPTISRMQAPDRDRPAGWDGGVALVGAGQNAPCGSPVGRLSVLRDQRAALQLPEDDGFDPYDLETVARRRAASHSNEE